MKKVIIFLYLILISAFTYSQVRRVQIKDLDEATTLTSGDKFIIQKVNDDVQYTTWGFIDAEIDPPVVDSALVADTAYHSMTSGVADSALVADTAYHSMTSGVADSALVADTAYTLQGVDTSDIQSDYRVEISDSNYWKQTSETTYRDGYSGSFSKLNDSIIFPGKDISASFVRNGFLFFHLESGFTSTDTLAVYDISGGLSSADSFDFYVLPQFDAFSSYQFYVNNTGDTIIFMETSAATDYLCRYVMSTPYKPSTGTIDQTVGMSNRDWHGLFVMGTSLYLTSPTNDVIDRYEFGSPLDLSTLSVLRESYSTPGMPNATKISGNSSENVIYTYEVYDQLISYKLALSDSFGVVEKIDTSIYYEHTGFGAGLSFEDDIMYLNSDTSVVSFSAKNNTIYYNDGDVVVTNGNIDLNSNDIIDADSITANRFVGVADSAADAGALQGISNTSNMATDTLYHAGALTPYLNATYGEIDKSVHDSILLDTDEWVITYNSGDTLGISNKTYSGDVLQLLPDGGVICNSLQWALEDTSTAANKVYGNQVFNSADSVMYIYGGDDAWHPLW